ncbi:unnamed protein product [Cylicocyclus nassatus]|uniref:CCHC-type domain-containing protein n=1 Tax=Cylicocyclus nassatus TaxID=53992 RepID=A0AA36H9V6_CYLNA|nr:unnamed protein product [Cylicocyclus nassatus]
MAEGSSAARKTPRGASSATVSAPGKKVMNVLSEMHKSVLNKPREMEDSMEVGPSKEQSKVRTDTEWAPLRVALETAFAGRSGDSIERSKEILDGGNEIKRYNWKKRYQFHEHSGKELQEPDERRTITVNSRTDMSRCVEVDQNRATRGVAWRKTSCSGKPACQEKLYTGLGRPEERGGTDQRRCFNCRRYGHIGRECPYKRTQVNQIEKTKGFLQNGKQDNLTEVIGKATSLGLKVYMGSKGSLVGEKCAAQISMLNLQVPAILDTGSMISIVPVGVLARAKKAGYDVDVLEVIPDRKLNPVYDASTNRMNFLGAVKVPVKLEGGKKSIVAFHISDVKDDDVLIGTNALAALGVDIILKTEERQQDVLDGKRVVVTKRVYIPPHNSILVPARCEGGSELEERVVWPSREDLPVGVFTVKNQELDIPVMNTTEKPMILKEGEELGQWGTEKWKSKWEEMNPLMMDKEIPHLDREERRNILYAQLREGSKIKFWKDGAVCMDPDGLRKLLRVAYKRCIDWTEFICENEGIRRHERIDNYEFDRIYDAAFRRAKMELEGEEQGHGPVKEGGTAFAAPASALLLERDGPKRGILTRVATTFNQLKEVLQEWKDYRTWVIVWPKDQLAVNSDLCEVMKTCVQQFEEGGKIVTVWPPIMEKIADEWKKLIEL